MEDELAILSVPTPAGKSTMSVPASNMQFVYTAGRAMSFWPIKNGNDATWIEADIAPLYANNEDSNLSFKGKLVNIDHSIGRGKGSIILGTTIAEKYIAGVGIDVLNQLDRRCLEDNDLKADDFGLNGEYSKQSVEVNVDRTKSKFIVMVSPNSTRLEDQKIYSAEEAAAMGIRRGELYDGKFKVVEACYPIRVRGVAMVGNPADTTANVYDIAASQQLIEDAAVKTPPSDTYEDSSALDNEYAKTQPMSISNNDTSGMDDGAFAVVQGGEELAGTAPSIRKRELPLYESNKHLYSGIPHKGLIKAALAGIGPDKDGKRPYRQDVHSAALQRVRSAHQQLTGDYSMAITAEEIAAIKDPLDRAIVELQEKIRIAGEEKASSKTAEGLLTDQIALKDTELAKLVADNKALKDAADEAASEVVASARLLELSAIEGFAVSDTEKAALVALLKDESEDQFKNRKLTEVNASLTRKLAAGGTSATDEKASLALTDEHAGLRLLDGSKVTALANSAQAALFA